MDVSPRRLYGCAHIWGAAHVAVYGEVDNAFGHAASTFERAASYEASVGAQPVGRGDAPTQRRTASIGATARPPSSFAPPFDWQSAFTHA